MGDNEPSDFNADRAELFEALGHPTRIKILEALNEGSLGFSEIKRKVGLDSNGLLSFHLGKLDDLVRLTQDGSYAITDQGREALRVVSTASSRGERSYSSGAILQSYPGADDSDIIVARRRREKIALTILVVVIVVGAIALYYSSTAYTQVYVDFTVAGNRVYLGIRNDAPTAVTALVISVNGSALVNESSTTINPRGGQWAYATLPKGLVISQGTAFNVTVMVGYPDGTRLVKSTMLIGLTSTTFLFSE
jgi:DNA-binding transcriptional ArsR family regulator